MLHWSVWLHACSCSWKLFNYLLNSVKIFDCDWIQYSQNIHIFHSVTTCKHRHMCSEFLLISPNVLTLACWTHNQILWTTGSSFLFIWVQLVNLDWLYEKDTEPLVRFVPFFHFKRKVDFLFCNIEVPLSSHSSNFNHSSSNHSALKNAPNKEIQRDKKESDSVGMSEELR